MGAKKLAFIVTAILAALALGLGTAFAIDIPSLTAALSRVM